MQEVHYDEPIKAAEQDRLERDDLVEYCADTLSSVRSSSSFVVGLSGPWGSGKTSFLNLLRERLLASTDPPTIVNFNPWLYTSHEQLLTSFFSEVNKAIGTKEGGRLGKAITDYADSLAEVGSLALNAIPPVAAINALLPFAKGLEKMFVKRAIKRAGDALSAKEKTPEESRAALTTELEKLDKNVVILMDDVDRLTSDEIRALFKFVTLVASFPHLTYMLAYDQQVVCSALEAMQGIDGRRYLEKVVQLPIELPSPSQNVIDAQLREGLSTYMDSIRHYRLEGTERSRFTSVYRSLVLGNTKTPREVKRYVNKVNSTAQLLGEEICPTDLLGMTAVALYYPNVHEWVWANREEVCGQVFHMDSAKDAWTKPLLRSLDLAIDSDHDDKDILGEALALLYPEIARWRSSSAYHPQATIQESSGRVANIRNMEVYYGAAHVGEVTRAHLKDLVRSADAHALSSGLLQLNETGELGRFLEIVQTDAKQLPPDRAKLIAKRMFAVVGDISQSEDVPIFEFPLPMKYANTLSVLLRAVGTEAADDITRTMTKGFEIREHIGLTWFLRDERRSQISDDQSKPCLSANTYEKLAQRYAACIIRNLPKLLFGYGHPAKFFWRLLDEDLGLGYLEKIRDRFGNNVALRCVSEASELGHWMNSSAQSGYGYDTSPSTRDKEALFTPVDISDIEAFATTPAFATLVDEIQERVAALYLIKQDEQLSRGRDPMRKATIDEAARQVHLWLNQSQEG